jgi:hypothetical protein
MTYVTSRQQIDASRVLKLGKEKVCVFKSEALPYRGTLHWYSNIFPHTPAALKDRNGKVLSNTLQIIREL